MAPHPMALWVWPATLPFLFILWILQHVCTIKTSGSRKTGLNAWATFVPWQGCAPCHTTKSFKFKNIWLRGPQWQKQSPSVAGGLQNYLKDPHLLVFKPLQKLLSPGVGWTMGLTSNEYNTAKVTGCHF